MYIDFDTRLYRDIKKKNPKKHSKLQTFFKGNNTTMRNHIARMGMSVELGHYNIYRQKCLEGKVEMHSRCMPDEEVERLRCKAGISDSSAQCVRVGTTSIIDLRADRGADRLLLVAKHLSWILRRLSQRCRIGQRTNLMNKLYALSLRLTRYDRFHDVIVSRANIIQGAFNC
jgi:hypothetical protein